MKKHEKIHYEEKDYECDICGKTFAQQAGLNNHKKRHIKEKPTKRVVYECSPCGKSFTNKLELMNHAKIHNE